MFNTDEEIDVFIPYSTKAMLAIKKESAYKICIIQSGSEYIEKCSNENEKLILDEDGNKCIYGQNDLNLENNLILKKN